MSRVSVLMASPEGVVLTVLQHLRNGQIDLATACFAEEFRFKDYGIGLEFREKKRLADYFDKTRELYPDSSIVIDAIFVSGEDVITEWTLQATLTEAFYGSLLRSASVSLHGASSVRTDNGKVTDWVDYYDGRTSRRTALAEHFTEWVEL